MADQYALLVGAVPTGGVVSFTTYIIPLYATKSLKKYCDVDEYTSTL
jgi:hypothetical protein